MYIDRKNITSKNKTDGKQKSEVAMGSAQKRIDRIVYKHHILKIKIYKISKHTKIYCLVYIDFIDRMSFIFD